MSVHVVTTSTLYKVENDTRVTLRITIGDAQGGGWLVAWDSDHVIAKGSDPEVIELGLGKDLKSRDLQVNVTAVDIQPNTNRLSRILTLEGGSAGSKQLLDEWDDGNDGDAALFSTVIGFE